MKYLFLLWFVFSCLYIKAKETSLKPIKRYSISEGLSNNGVTSIIEDSKGYMWFGTYDGLNRYDGYDFKVYRNSPEEEIFISNRVRSLFEDSKENIWIGTDEGISVYIREYERFRSLYSNTILKNGKSGPVVLKILEEPTKGRIICATEDEGILFFDNNYEFSGNYKPARNVVEDDVKFYDISILDKDHLLLASSSGLFTFDMQTKRFDWLYKSNDSFPFVKLAKVNSEEFLLTSTQGLVYFTCKKQKDKYTFKRLRKYFDRSSLSYAVIDPNKNLWLGKVRKECLVKINDLESLLHEKNYHYESYNPDNEINRVSSIFFSPTNGDCWVGTFSNGIIRLESVDNPFKTFNTQSEAPSNITKSEVLWINNLDDKRSYLSIRYGGLCLYNLEKEKFEEIPLPLDRIPVAAGGAIFIDSNKNTWLKLGRRGLYMFDKNQKRSEKIIIEDNPAFNTLAPRSIIEDRYGHIWMAGKNGVFRLTVDKNGGIQEVEDIKENSLLKKMDVLGHILYVDPEYDFLWLGTIKTGLFRISLKEDTPLRKLDIKQFTHHKKDPSSITSNFVSTILRLPNKQLWVGTERGGICKVIDEHDNPTFIPYTEKKGLSNNVVASMLYDNQNNLWIGTNNGLNRFNTITETFRIFTKEEGLPFDLFNYPASKLANNVLMFGGSEGICYFNPAHINESHELPNLEFGELKVFNSIITPNDTVNGRIILHKALSYQKEITLKHDENVFSVEVKSLHFSSQDNRFLKYQLLPESEEWIQIPSSQKQLYFNSLSAGDYELRVKASNSINEWTEAKSIFISIKPPFWKTKQAFLLYVFVLGFIIYVIFIYRVKLNSLKYELKFEQLEKDKAKEVNDAKLRFFSNISHEIKTPLTLIAGPIHVLSQSLKANQNLLEKVKIVQRQSKKLSQLVEQVHDFQKSDSNKLKLNSTVFCFNTFIKDLVKDFEFMAQVENKTLKVVDTEHMFFVLADKDKLEKVINNLLNNSFKHTSVNDIISVEYSVEKDDVIIKVKDTGHGIEEDDLPYIFERFYQSRKKGKKYFGGSGIGLAFSKRLVEMHYGYIKAESIPEEETVITVQLPVVKHSVTNAHLENELKILSIEKEMEQQVHVNQVKQEMSITIDKACEGALVFYVEDNSEMRLFVSSILSTYFNVRSFSNGLECLKEMENEWPDIVVSDVLMPELNGFELCKKIKSEIKTSHIPVILLTACIADSEKLQGIKVGADSYIQKPFDQDQLIAKVESLLINRTKLRERYKIDYPLKKGKQSNNGQKDRAFLDKFYTIISENVDNEEIAIDDVARTLGLNRTDFYKKVKTLTNQTPYELIKDFKVKKAADLLVQDQVTVNEAYMMAGFKSRSSFNRMFKEKYGVPPGQYVKHVKSKYQ